MTGVQTCALPIYFTGSLVPSLSYTPTDHAGLKTAYFQSASAKDGKFTTVTGYITLK